MSAFYVPYWLLDIYSYGKDETCFTVYLKPLQLMLSSKFSQKTVQGEKRTRKTGHVLLNWDMK